MLLDLIKIFGPIIYSRFSASSLVGVNRQTGQVEQNHKSPPFVIISRDDHVDSVWNYLVKNDYFDFDTCLCRCPLFCPQKTGVPLCRSPSFLWHSMAGNLSIHLW